MITLSQSLVQDVAGDPVADVCLGHDTRFQVHGDKLTELLDDPEMAESTPVDRCRRTRRLLPARRFGSFSAPASRGCTRMWR